MIVEFIDEHKEEFGVEPICRVLREHGLQIAPSTNRAAKARPPSARTQRDAAVLERIRTVRGDRAIGRGLYGVRKVHAQLRRDGGVAGRPVSRRQVERLMRADGLQGARRGRAIRTTRADATANARDGARTTFQHFDETHRFILPRLIDAHETMLQNVPKRMEADAWSLETTTTYTPGEGSVAEATHEKAEQLVRGRRDVGRSSSSTGRRCRGMGRTWTIRGSCGGLSERRRGRRSPGGRTSRARWSRSPTCTSRRSEPSWI